MPFIDYGSCLGGTVYEPLKRIAENSVPKISGKEPLGLEKKPASSKNSTPIKKTPSPK